MRSTSINQTRFAELASNLRSNSATLIDRGRPDFVGGLFKIKARSIIRKSKGCLIESSEFFA